MSERLLTSLSKREILQVIVHRPLWIILAAAVVTLFFGWQVPKLSIRTSIYDLVIEDLRLRRDNPGGGKSQECL